MKASRPDWAQIHLKTVLTMIQTKLGASDPSAAIVAALLEIGDALNDMADRTEAATERAIDARDHSAGSLQIRLARIAANLSHEAEIRHRRLTRGVLAAIAAATLVILFAIGMKDGRGTSFESSQQASGRQGDKR